MLRRLAIQNYALIDSLDIEFPGGLIIITGETGAGKSIMMGALSLLLGAKADVSALKDNTRNCVVSLLSITSVFPYCREYRPQPHPSLSTEALQAPLP